MEYTLILFLVLGIILAKRYQLKKVEEQRQYNERLNKSLAWDNYFIDKRIKWNEMYNKIEDERRLREWKCPESLKHLFNTENQKRNKL